MFSPNFVSTQNTMNCQNSRLKTRRRSARFRPTKAAGRLPVASNSQAAERVGDRVIANRITNIGSLYASC